LAAAAARAADAEALALADRVECETVVRADHAPVVGDDRTRARRQITAEELAERALADEADAGGVLALRVRQTDRCGDLAHFALVQFAQWEQRARELRLRQAMQEVALVLAAVDAAQ